MLNLIHPLMVYHQVQTKFLNDGVRRCGVIVVEIDEFNTSKSCCLCHSMLQKDVMGRSAKPPRRFVSSNWNHKIPVDPLWSVLRCSKNNCRVGHKVSKQGLRVGFWNRDENAAFNNDPLPHLHFKQHSRTQEFFLKLSVL